MKRIKAYDEKLMIKEQKVKKFEQEMINLKQNKAKDSIRIETKNTIIVKEKEYENDTITKDKHGDKTESFQKYWRRIYKEEQRKHARY